MNKDVSRWALVSAPIVMAGSAAQRINVMQMALDDIATLGRELAQQDTAALDTLSQLSAQHEERMAVLRAELDELIAVLRWCAGRGCIDGGMTDAEQRATMARVNAVIAKVGAP